MSKFDVIVVGGGLSGSLIAYRLCALRADLRVLLLEASGRLGGNHTWSFHGSDVTGDQRAWLTPLIGAHWSGYSVAFRGRARDIESSYFSVPSSGLHDVVRDALGDSVRTGVRAASVQPTAVRLESGELFEAGAVIDARGGAPGPHLNVAYQKFLGREVRLSEPHNLLRPVLMDATVPQRDGFRFVYLLPFDETRLLIEDTYYADTPALDREALRDGLVAYARQRGWTIETVIREESGILPILLGGDIGAHWDSLEGNVPAVGLRGGFFHATTGYSLPDAVRVADLLARQKDLDAEPVYRLLRREAQAQWRRQRFFRALNRMLFLAAEPDARHAVFQRFYGLPAPLISRFYAGRPTVADKARILTGRPPVSHRGRPQGPGRRRTAHPNRKGGRMKTHTAAVIGSGFGGLAAAIRLQSAGVKTTIFEARDKPGGRAYVYEDRGFTFDAGPTVITDPSCLEELFQLSGRRLADYVDLLPVDPFYRLIWQDGHTFDYANDQGELDRQIAEISPEDVDGYRRFYAYSEAVFREGYQKLGHVPFPKLLEHGPCRPPTPETRQLSERSRRCCQIHQAPAPAAGLQLSFAAGGRQSLPDVLNLCADPCAGAALGRPLPQRRHRRPGAGHGASFPRFGWRNQAEQSGRYHRHRRQPGIRHQDVDRVGRRFRDGHQQRRCRPHLSDPAAA